MINQLVRQAIASINFGASWQALQAPGWTDVELTTWQAALEGIPLLVKDMEKSDDYGTGLDD